MGGAIPHLEGASSFTRSTTARWFGLLADHAVTEAMQASLAVAGTPRGPAGYTPLVCSDGPRQESAVETNI